MLNDNEKLEKSPALTFMLQLNLQEAKSQGLFNSLTLQQLAAVNAILIECEKQEVTNKSQIAYILATAWHESKFKPIIEQGGEKYLKSKKYWPYVGRGMVQLTWKHNYEKQGKRLDIDLVNNPSLALDIPIAANILVYGMKHGEFTGKKLTNYITSEIKDYFQARRIINILDKAQLIAGYAMKFERCI
jgi:hypothetical protein